MSGYVEKSISKRRDAESAAKDVLALREAGRGADTELIHGAWIAKARKKIKRRSISHPLFGLLVIFAILFAGSVYLFENMDILTGELYAVKIVITSLFAVTMGFLLSVWWSSTSKFDENLKEAERIDVEYREELMSFSDSLFDIVNALNTLASKPPRSFIVATEFLLGEYVHLLQSRLQRYGDYIAGLGFDATDFLDEKIRIFEGIRERASLAIEGMPKEIENVFVEGLSLSELDDASVCCGFGGTFCVKYPEVSNKMVTIKAEKVEASGADTLLAGDLGCLMNMAGKLQRRGAAVKARHVAEVLAGMADGPAIGEGE